MQSAHGRLVTEEAARNAWMKILVIAVVVALIAGSVYADYRWKKWLNARRGERQD